MKLQSIKFINNKLFNDKSIIFSSDNQDISNYTTVIIGPNGTGKSSLLREISRIFRDTYGRQNGPVEKKVLEYKYEFSYFLDKKFYDVIFENGKRNYYINNKKCDLNDWTFPNTVIAVSSTPTDKFVFSNNIDESIYKYAGIRSSNSSCGTKTLIKNIINLLAKTDLKKFKPLDKLLTELKFKKELIIYYEEKVPYLNNIFKNIKDLDNYFENWQKRTSRKTIPFNINYYKNIDLPLKQQIIKFLKNKFDSNFLGFNILDPKGFQEFKDNAEVLNALYKLDLLKTPEILFNKDEKYNNDLEISSGEYNLIFQFIRILLLLENNSLLLIDEPEISLHPNWQIKYLAFLEKILSSYTGIHTIIATHSHLLLTNLNPDNSNVITITGNKEFETLEYSVSGWSPENILYRVFGVTAYRNKYFETDLRKIISYIETGDGEINEIKKIINNIERFNLTDDDPLKQIINNVKRVIENEASK